MRSLDESSDGDTNDTGNHRGETREGRSTVVRRRRAGSRRALSSRRGAVRRGGAARLRARRVGATSSRRGARVGRGRRRRLLRGRAVRAVRRAARGRGSTASSATAAAARAAAAARGAAAVGAVSRALADSDRGRGSTGTAAVGHVDGELVTSRDGGRPGHAGVRGLSGKVGLDDIGSVAGGSDLGVVRSLTTVPRDLQGLALRGRHGGVDLEALRRDDGGRDSGEGSNRLSEHLWVMWVWDKRGRCVRSF